MEEKTKTKIEIIKNIVSYLDGKSQVECQENLDNEAQPVLTINIHTNESARLLIGKNGDNLKALEHVCRMIFAKEQVQTSLLLDVNNYRKSRALLALDVAKETASRVRNTLRAEALSPMSSYERRLIHAELASYTDVTTESIGEGPQRRIVIKPLSII